MRPRLNALTPYDPKPSTAKILLHANEVNIPLDLNVSPTLMSTLNRYPDHQATDLKQALASTYGYRKDSLMVGAGSSELLELMVKTFIDPGDVVLSLQPTFVMYEQYTLVHGGTYLGIPESSQTLSDLLTAVKTYQPQLIFLSNPNNPTGTYLSPDVVQDLLRAVSCPVVVDEAYIEYANEDNSLTKYVKDYGNLYVTRTFSKAFALAGARLGYLVSQPENIQTLKRTKTPYSVTAPSLLLGALALQQKKTMEKRIQTIIATRETVFKALQSFGIDVKPSLGNFLYFQEPRIDLHQALLAHGILIRAYPNHCYRLTIGTPEEMQTVLTTLKEIYA